MISSPPIARSPRTFERWRALAAALARSAVLPPLTLSWALSWVSLCASPPALAAERFAAVDADSNASAPVVWGRTEAEARRRATEACRRVSATCAGSPALTGDMGDVFAVFCCDQPRVGCAVSAAATRGKALREVERMFGAAGYTHCALRHYLSAASGKRR
jgi:hypothetical protein